MLQKYSNFIYSQNKARLPRRIVGAEPLLTLNKRVREQEPRTKAFENRTPEGYLAKTDSSTLPLRSLLEVSPCAWLWNFLGSFLTNDRVAALT